MSVSLDKFVLTVSAIELYPEARLVVSLDTVVLTLTVTDLPLPAGVYLGDYTPSVDPHFPEAIGSAGLELTISFPYIQTPLPIKVLLSPVVLLITPQDFFIYQELADICGLESILNYQRMDNIPPAFVGTNDASTWVDDMVSPNVGPNPASCLMVASPENVYIAHNNGNYGNIRNKLLVDQGVNVPLACPWGLSVDATHVYVWESSRNLLSKRLKTDLSEVDTVYENYGYGVHTDKGDIVWTFHVSGTTGLAFYNKSDLSLRAIHSGAIPNSNGQINFARDITSDNDYVYVADSGRYRVARYERDLDALVFVDSFGTPDWFVSTANDVAISGSYAYIISLNQLIKVDLTTWNRVDAFGEFDGGNEPENGFLPSPYCVVANGTRLYVVCFDSLVILNQADMSYVTHIDQGGYGDSLTFHAPWWCDVDGSYIYVCDFNAMITKWDIATLTCVAENGDRTGVTTDGENAYSTPFGIVVDSTYMYILDQNDDLRVIRRLKSDLSYVDEYRDVGWAIFHNPQAINVDGTYIYVSDPGAGGIHRINKGTMAYVDFIDTSSHTEAPMGTEIVGTDIYIADYNASSLKSCCQKYDVATFTFLEEAAFTTYGDSNYWLCIPYGITVDESYIYVSLADIYSHYEGNKVKIYNKTTFAYVDEFDIVDGYPQCLAVDESYLYIPVRGIAPSYLHQTRRYLKTPPYTIINYVSEPTVISLDTAWVYQLGWYPSSGTTSGLLASSVIPTPDSDEDCNMTWALYEIRNKIKGVIH